MFQVKSSRRDMLQKALSFILVYPVIASFRASADAPKPALLSESDPQASALGYAADAKKVDLKKWPKRTGAEGAKQFCYNCQFYQNASGDPKASKSAPCQIFAGKAVMAQGWCNTWTQNPKVKS